MGNQTLQTCKNTPMVDKLLASVPLNWPPTPLPVQMKIYHAKIPVQIKTYHAKNPFVHMCSDLLMRMLPDYLMVSGAGLWTRPRSPDTVFKSGATSLQLSTFSALCLSPSCRIDTIGALLQLVGCTSASQQPCCTAGDPQLWRGGRWRRAASLL